MAASYQKPDNLMVENNNLIQNILKQISSCCEEEKSLMISVFDIKRNKFHYCNDSFKNVLGYNSREIINGGWEFWYKKINPAEVWGIKSEIEFLIQKSFSEKHSKMLSFTYHIKDLYNKWCFLNHDLSLRQIKKDLIIINYFYDISQKERIEYFLGTKTQVSLNKDITISKREKEVLQLIAEGFSSKQIAEELYISNHTAIAHRKNLIEKFKVKNTAQLIKEASRSFLM